MPVKERGFSLLEVLIAMSISSVLLLSASRFLPSLQQASLWQMRQQTLEEEIWQRVYVVAKHLQRAGYCAGECQGQGLQLANEGACVIVRWDANSNGIWEFTPAIAADNTGFRWRNDALETLRGAASCEDKGWAKMTDPTVWKVTRFQVTQQERSGFSPVLNIVLSAVLAANPLMSMTAEYSVTGYNL